MYLKIIKYFYVLKISQISIYFAINNKFGTVLSESNLKPETQSSFHSADAWKIYVCRVCNFGCFQGKI